MAALSLVLRPFEAGFESGDSVATKAAVLDEDSKDVGDAAPEIVETATLTNAVVSVFAMCTANDPFSPQTPQSGTLRNWTNEVAAAGWYWAGLALVDSWATE